LTHNLYTIYI